MREKSSPTPRDLSKKDHGDCGANLFLTLKNEDGSVLAKQNLFGTYRLEWVVHGSCKGAIHLLSILKIG